MLDASPLSGTVAVVLSGGHGRRLGGVSKAAVEVGGRALLDLVLDAVEAAGVRRAVVVGDAPGAPRGWVEVTRERPAFGGPLAGLGAGLARVDGADDMLVLACDLPHAARLVPTLVSTHAGPDGPDGVVVVDASGHEQWLAGRYGSAALRAAVARVAAERGGDLGGAPARAALGSLRVTRLPDPGHDSDDVDTPEDLARARALAPAPPTAGGRP